MADYCQGIFYRHRNLAEGQGNRRYTYQQDHQPQQGRPFVFNQRNPLLLFLIFWLSLGEKLRIHCIGNILHRIYHMMAGHKTIAV